MLKEKSKGLERIELVFGFISNTMFLDAIFQQPEFKEEMDKISAVLLDVLQNGEW